MLWVYRFLELKDDCLVIRAGISNALLIFVVVLNYKNMNRQEFCQIIADIRKQSTIKMKDVCFQMGVMPTAIYRLEKGSNNFEMGNMMSYIKALQHILVIENGQHSYRTNDAQELGSILALIRKEKAISQRALAEKAGYSHLTIANIERKTTTISIDTLLKTVDVLGYTINIEKQ